MELADLGKTLSMTPAKQATLGMLLKRSGIFLFEYYRKQDRLILYDEKFHVDREIPSLFHYLKEKSGLVREDLWVAAEFFQGNLRTSIELQMKRKDGSGTEMKRLDALSVSEDGREECLFGYIQDVTSITEREKKLEDISKRDSLTGLYNHNSGKMLAGKYLRERDPYSSCGLMLLDIDYFKNVNDSYGHLFGDEVLKKLAELLAATFDQEDILVRTGGDEFAVFLKNIDYAVLVQKAVRLMESVRHAAFSRSEYCMTCSMGVCFLPENHTSTWEQLFENADRALYQAKENGRNQYVFCDSVRPGRDVKADGWKTEELDARYLRNDVVATAFEIFEKTESFDNALHLLLKVIGIRYRLDRITVIRTDIRDQYTARQYQWLAPLAVEALSVKSEFTREDFLTLFRSYDEYGTTVLQYDDMDMYSRGAQQLLMQGEAKTVVYAAMYSEGKYTGAISYVVCKNKRFWPRQSRKEFGELTKIIVAYLSRHLMASASQRERVLSPETDQLTGLLSFSRFREDVEQKILGGYASDCGILYTDFVDFGTFNQIYGFQRGDDLLRSFAGYIVEEFSDGNEVYFTRVVSDQFLLYIPCPDRKKAVERIRRIYGRFLDMQKALYPEAPLKLRSGLYFITPECLRASSAIEAANQARKETPGEEGVSLSIYEGRAVE